jgi:uncharacterized protein YndB with AHSA1/START domain
LAEIQKNIDLYTKLNTTVFALSTDSPKQSERVVNKLNLSATLLCDEDKKIVDLFNLRNPLEHDGIAHPATFIINPEGKICYRSLDGTAHRVDLTDELSFLEQFHKDAGHTMQAGAKKSWIIPSPKDNWRMTLNMIAAGNFADWKNLLLLPVNYSRIMVNKIRNRRFACREVDLGFLESAPVRFVNQVEIDAPPERVFEVLEDGESWPKWFKDIVRVEWTSPKPFGVGTTRTVTLKTMTVYEKFIAWDPGKRFTFYFTATSTPSAHAFIEDYRLKASGQGGTKFTYTVAYEPRLPLKMAGPVAKLILGNMFRNGARSLAAFMKEMD